MKTTTATAANRRRRQIEFFAAHAGYSTPPGRMACAKNLADAETYANDQGWEYLIMDDDERAYCYCDNPKCPYHEGSEKDQNDGWRTVAIVLYAPCAEHGISCKHAKALASLSGIMDPDDQYIRVVQAELAAEAMHDRERTEEIPADVPAR